MKPWLVKHTRRLNRPVWPASCTVILFRLLMLWSKSYMSVSFGDHLPSSKRLFDLVELLTSFQHACGHHTCPIHIFDACRTTAYWHAPGVAIVLALVQLCLRTCTPNITRPHHYFTAKICQQLRQWLCSDQPVGVDGIHCCSRAAVRVSEIIRAEFTFLDLVC